MEPSITSESCRICLEHSPEGKLLTDPYTYESAYDGIAEEGNHLRSYLDVYRFVAEINADPIVHLVPTAAVPAFLLEFPERICDECEAQLVAACVLRQKSIRSERALGDLLKPYEEEDKKPGFDEVLIEVKEEIIGAPPPEAVVECKVEIDEEEEQVKWQHLQKAKRSRTAWSMPSSSRAIKKQRVIDTNAASEDDESEGVANETIQFYEENYFDGTVDGIERQYELSEVKVEQSKTQNSNKPNRASRIKSSSSKAIKKVRTATNKSIIKSTTKEASKSNEDNDETAKSIPISEKRQCEDCGKFMCAQYLPRHRQQHRNVEKQPFSCQLCGSRFTLKENLGHHMRAVHENDRRFPCSHCDEKFLHWATRRYHILRHHTGETKFTCEYCGMKFFTKSHYNVHINRHTGVTPFGCGQCDRRFLTPFALKNHLSTHTDEKKFKCEFCQKCYKSGRSLRTHVRTLHEMQKNYVCPVCQQAFSQNHVMRSHIQRHHPEYVLPPSGTVVSIKAIERIKEMSAVAPIEDRADQEAKRKFVSNKLIG